MIGAGSESGPGGLLLLTAGPREHGEHDGDFVAHGYEGMIVHALGGILCEVEVSREELLQNEFEGADFGIGMHEFIEGAEKFSQCGVSQLT